jgi:transcriptional regulator with XRE-family HTH domain
MSHIVEKGVLTTMPEVIALAKNLRRIRKEMKLSQLEFALESEISLDIISMIERQQANPRLSTLQQISAYIGCTVADLLAPPKD